LEIEIIETIPVCLCGRFMEVVTDDFGFEMLICFSCSAPVEVFGFEYEDDGMF
jgi:hypothetical protein